MKAIAVYCGASPGNDPMYADRARDLARVLVERNIGLVYGGGKVGLMGVIADAVLAAGGTVVGVIPEALMEKELGHGGVTELHVVQTMHERKALMSELSDGFIALPGGYGTLEELFEVITWAQLGIQCKPCGLLNVGGYYNSLLALLDHATDRGFIREMHRGLVAVDDDPVGLLEKLGQYEPPTEVKWLRQEQT